jgi:hypothetical protein
MTGPSSSGTESTDEYRCVRKNPINTVSAHRAIPTVVSGYDSLTLGRVVVENFGIGVDPTATLVANSPAIPSGVQGDRLHDIPGARTPSRKAPETASIASF